MGFKIGGNKMVYERCEDDVWIEGTIKELQERMNTRKYKNDDTGEYEEREVDEMRFVFQLEGYKFNHFSRWMTKSTGENSNLFKKYLKKLIPDFEPNGRIDLEALVGKRVKTMWVSEEGKDGNTYQGVLQIKPVDEVLAEEVSFDPNPEDKPEFLK